VAGGGAEWLPNNKGYPITGWSFSWLKVSLMVKAKLNQSSSEHWFEKTFSLRKKRFGLVIKTFVVTFDPQ
jgi:hypothetical protein